MLQLKNSALGIIAATFEKLFEPPAKVTPAEWAAAELVVPDGPRANELWDPRLTPYIIEPLNNMGPDCPVNRESIKKSAQTGFTMMAIAVVGHAIVTDPAGGILLVQPTDGALNDFIRDKLNPAIEQSKSLKAAVKPQVSRSGEGSTAYSKRYAGGSMAMGAPAGSSPFASESWGPPRPSWSRKPVARNRSCGPALSR